ncbi:MAG: cobalt transporter CbiM [Acidobacteriota bacterium]
MHIPDGYLGPATALATWGIMVPVWGSALRHLRKGLEVRRIPLLSLGAAFSFLIMMFNIPIPGGTTGHAVGSVLVALLLGPWAAVISVSLALALQALLFGDGGITALGANCLTMAGIMPLAGWAAFRLTGATAPPDSRRRYLAAGFAAYAGLNAAALATAGLLGIQPLLASDASGRPLYCPYGLGVAVPVMAAEHLLLFGFVEAIVTSVALKWLDRTEPGLAPGPAVPAAPYRKLWGWLLVLLVLTPLGFLVPRWAGAAAAWGEWSPEELIVMLGYVPARLERWAAFWRAPVPDYAEEAGPLGYLLAGALGIAVLGALYVGLKTVTRVRGDRG